MRKVTIVLLVSALLACDITPPPTFNPNNPGNDNIDELTIEVTSNLFIPGEETGLTLFETGDPQYWNSRGTSLWYLLEENPETFTSRETGLSKLSGDGTAGYGLVFCYRDDPENGNTMLVILINTLKEYIVAEISESNFKTVIPWTESPFLNAGYNQRNVLKLEYNGSTGDYLLYINDNPETTFRDDNAPVHTVGRPFPTRPWAGRGTQASMPFGLHSFAHPWAGRGTRASMPFGLHSFAHPWAGGATRASMPFGQSGYMVVISSYDEFPDIPVKIQFTEIIE